MKLNHKYYKNMFRANFDISSLTLDKLCLAQVVDVRVAVVLFLIGLEARMVFNYIFDHGDTHHKKQGKE